LAEKRTADLETLLGYSFNEPELMERAMATKGARPASSEGPGLAVLGEAVICCAVVNHFYSQGMSQAQINEEREARVCRENYARIAEEIGLRKCLMPSSGSPADMLRGSALGERFEEIMGAIYLDDVNAGGTGIGACWEVLRNVNMI
jgi:dsRNA-specific ribonuclease